MARQPILESLIGISANDLAKLSKEDLFKLAKKVIRRTNQRLSKIEKAGLEFSPAYSKHPNKISSRGLNKLSKKQLRNKLTEATAILRDPTSTIKGARKHIEQINNELNKGEKVIFKRKIQFGKKWGRIVSRLQELYPNISPSVIKDIVEELSQNDPNLLNMNEEEVTNYIAKQIGSGYVPVQSIHRWKPKKYKR